MTACRCADIPILWAAEADAYAGGHLVREEVLEGGVSVMGCMASGRCWLQDHPLDAAGVATLRLRWTKVSPSDVVAYLVGKPGLDAQMLTMDPQVEHQPLPGAPG